MDRGDQKMRHVLRSLGQPVTSLPIGMTPTTPSDWSVPDGPRMERLLEHADVAYQIVSNQISSDYVTFFKAHVQSRIPRAQRLALRPHMVLIALASFDRPMSGSEITEITTLNKATISRALAKLDGLGLIESQEDGHDRRLTTRTLSAAGRQLADDYLAAWADAVDWAEPRIGYPFTKADTGEIMLCVHRLRDRARAFSLYQPGRMHVFRAGLARPSPADRHGLDRMLPLADSYFRFFTEYISSDYLKCLSKRAVAPVLKGSDLGVTDLQVMMAADFYERPITQSDIAKSMRFDTATLARSSAALQSHGLIDLVALEDDARTRAIRLTQAGQAVADRYRRRTTSLSDRVEFHYDMHWSEDMRRDMLRALMRLRERASRLAAL